MNFVVHMTAFLNKENIRIVEVPDNEIQDKPDNVILEKVFHYGQNDFQSQSRCLPSVSVGDIIKIRELEYWIVLSTGFKQMTPQEFGDINEKLGVKAYMMDNKETTQSNEK